MKMTTRRHRTDPTEALAALRSEWGQAPMRGAELAREMVGAPLFAEVEPAELRSTLEAFDEVHFPGGRRVLLEGLRGDDFFLIVTGTAAVLVDGWRVATLGPGDFFGEMAVLGDGLRTASIRAETPLRCLVLPNGKLEQLLLAHPKVGLNLLHRLVGRFGEVARGAQRPATEMSER